jgi:hypothetical protein
LIDPKCVSPEPEVHREIASANVEVLMIGYLYIIASAIEERGCTPNFDWAVSIWTSPLAVHDFPDSSANAVDPSVPFIWSKETVYGSSTESRTVGVFAETTFWLNINKMSKTTVDARTFPRP